MKQAKNNSQKQSKAVIFSNQYKKNMNFSSKQPEDAGWRNLAKDNPQNL